MSDSPASVFLVMGMYIIMPGKAYSLYQTPQADGVVEVALHWGYWAILAPLLVLC